jgi:predicted metal-dependent phosphoesterase TrpH
MNPEHLGSHIEALNDPQPARRLEELRRLSEALLAGALKRPAAGEDVNNHIHTFYSFSPYSPAKAVWMSAMSGLTTAGIMDHDTISGAAEFIEAGREIGLATTIGLECRCDFSSTALAGRRLNNPDQLSVAYIALHGVPHGRIKEVREYFRPLQEERNERNRRMVSRLNDYLGWPELALDFEADVVPLSRSGEQGTITERHILYALALRLIELHGRGRKLVRFLEQDLRLPLTSRVLHYLLDLDNPYYSYDLLGAFKSDLVAGFYLDAGAECPPVSEFLAFSRRIGAIAAYAYLGDITESVTGDKKAQSFEDSYLEELFQTITGLGFQAVTYMPNRNTPEQLARVQALCDRYSLFQISGVDINSPRQSFTCPELRLPQYRHLIRATWALIGHELEATEDSARGMFSEEILRRHPRLEERIAVFAEIGRKRAGAPPPDCGRGAGA